MHTLSTADWFDSQVTKQEMPFESIRCSVHRPNLIKYEAMVMARKRYELDKRDLVIDDTEICQEENFRLLGVILQ